MTTDRRRRDEVARGRDAGARAAWAEAYDALTCADRAAPLDPADLELLATAAYLLGRTSESLRRLRQAYEASVRAGDVCSAARAAFWTSFAHGNRGEFAHAGGWLSRAERLLAAAPAECAERGLVLLPEAFRLRLQGEHEAARDLAARAAEIGRRTGDPDLQGLAMCLYGGELVREGRVAEGIGLLDDAMVAAASAEISPLAAGTVYCTGISVCYEIAELHRARAWTRTLTAWCGRQPDLVVFSGQCLIHRAELLRMEGDWEGAIEEADRACKRPAGAPDAFASGAAHYQLGEIRRMRGDLQKADESYRQASEHGHEPQPGLALLQLARGRTEAAHAAVRRGLNESSDPFHRARLLPALVEIALTVGDVAEARRASDELAGLADLYRTRALRATADHARGTVAAADADPAGALPALRSALRSWQDLDMPYESARCRVSIAVACRALGDEDGAELELDAAARVLARLEAAPDLERVEGLRALGRLAPPHGLTRRELDVLLRVAAGKTNRAIAGELFLSEKTVERHVSNIFDKLAVTSRAAATAYAYRHRLIG